MKQNEIAIRNMDNKTVNKSHINSKNEVCEIIHFIRRWRFYLFKKGVCGERRKVTQPVSKRPTHAEKAKTTQNNQETRVVKRKIKHD